MAGGHRSAYQTPLRKRSGKCQIMKKIVVSLVAGIIILSMSGCAGKTSGKETSSKETVNKEASNEETPDEETSDEEASYEEASAEEISTEETSTEKTGKITETTGTAQVESIEAETEAEVETSGGESKAGWVEVGSSQNYTGTDNIWKKYLNEVLLKRFGKFNSYHLEYGYGETEMGFRPMPTGIGTGIMGTHIEDMDLDGVPEFMVFMASPSQEFGIERGIDINMHTYSVKNGMIKYAGENRLCTNFLLEDAGEFNIFIKQFANKKIIGASSGGHSYISGDGSTYEINLYQIKGDTGIKNLCNLSESASEWDDTKDSWKEIIWQQGFEVTADEWEQGTDVLYISSNEPDCKSLIAGSYKLNMPIADFYSSEPKDGEKDNRKIIADFTIQN